MQASDAYLARHAAQVPILGEQGQLTLSAARVHIAGLGRLGAAISFALVSGGFRNITANDPQELDDEIGGHVWARTSDVGKPKATALERYLGDRRPDVRFEAIVAPSESPTVATHVSDAELVVIASNTVSSRRAMERRAIAVGADTISAGVADGRGGLGGVIAVRQAKHRWHACAACHLPREEPVRGEGLLFSMISIVASHATQIAVQLAVGENGLGENNLWFIDGSSHEIHGLAVERRPDCDVCGG